MKENRECSLVKDLLPLYIDHLASDESEQFIHAHLETCGKCIHYYDGLLEERKELLQMEEKNMNGLKRLLKRHRYEMIGLVSGIITILVVMIAAIIFAVQGSSTAEQEYSVKEHYEQVEDYGKQHYAGISQLALFPDTSVTSGNVTNFYYDCKGQKLYQDYQIYLKCYYETDVYEAEKNRLLHVTDEITGTSVCYTEDEFTLPGVYAMLYDDGHEYALFSDEECSVIYIYLQGIDRRNLYFDTTYLPKDYGQYGYLFETEREPFRIYPAYQGGIDFEE